MYYNQALMSIAEKLEETDLRMLTSTDQTEEALVPIPMATPNYLGLISMGIRALPPGENFSYKENPTSQALLRSKDGQTTLVEHNRSNDHLIDFHASTGEFRVRYQHSAQAIDLLDGHLAVQNARVFGRQKPINRQFSLFDKDGNFVEDAQLVNLKPHDSNGRKKHKAKFSHKVYGESGRSNEVLDIPIDDIYCINYKIPGKLALEKARALSALRSVKSRIRFHLRNDSDE
jgi:hypothetical protein